MVGYYFVDNVGDRFDTYDDAIDAAHTFLADNPIVAWVYVFDRLPHGTYAQARVHPDGIVQKLDY